MKNLANCTPREFLRQTNKIRHAVKDWLDATGVMEMRKRLPERPEGMEDDEWRALVNQHMNATLTAMLDAVLEEHPDETAELLGLMCFIPPEELDNHTMSELLGGYAEMIGNREVLDFFISLSRLGMTNTFAPASASASISLSSMAAAM